MGPQRASHMASNHDYMDVGEGREQDAEALPRWPGVCFVAAQTVTRQLYRRLILGERLESRTSALGVGRCSI